MVPRSLQKITKSDLPLTCLLQALPILIPPQNSLSMDPTHQHVPTPEELHLAVVEQALIDSKAREIEMKNQFAALLNSFQQLGLLMRELTPAKIPKTTPTDTIPIRLAPTGRPPPLALPSEYDGDRLKGQAFLISCQTYMHLCPDSFQIFYWEEKNPGYSKFLDWDEFQNEFRKDFCPAHSDVAAINKLESTTYYQKSRSINDYLDEFVELVAEAGYTDPKIVVVKFQKGLDPQIQNTIATMAYGHPSDTSPESWYEAAKNVDQNRMANEAFKSAYQAPASTPTRLTSIPLHPVQQSQS